MFLNRKLIVAAIVFCFASSVYADMNTQPAKETQKTTQSTDAVTVSAATDINKASMSDLMKVKGISKKKAKSIISYRKKHGDFKSLDDLKNVSGFKKMKEEDMKAIQDQLTIA